MCRRLSQYSGTQDFEATLSMPNALVSSTSEQPLERYNAAPTAQFALFYQRGQFLHADLVLGQYPNEEHHTGEHHAFVVITVDSAGGVDIHDRRPVLLTPELARALLDFVTPKKRSEQRVLDQHESANIFEWFRVGLKAGTKSGSSANNARKFIKIRPPKKHQQG